MAREVANSAIEIPCAASGRRWLSSRWVHARTIWPACVPLLAPEPRARGDWWACQCYFAPRVPAHRAPRTTRTGCPHFASDV
eukprot:33182-Prymnesium_polylepis.2